MLGLGSVIQYIASMYGIFTYIYHKKQTNLGIRGLKTYVREQAETVSGRVFMLPGRMFPKVLRIFTLRVGFLEATMRGNKRDAVHNLFLSKVFFFTFCHGFHHRLNKPLGPGMIWNLLLPSILCRSKTRVDIYIYITLLCIYIYVLFTLYMF